MTLQTQHRYGNTTGHALSFDTMNGTSPTLANVIDETYRKEDIRMIEIFSDGYMALPEANPRRL